MRSDLASLFTRPPTGSDPGGSFQNVTFIDGSVVAWDPVTGANTIMVDSTPVFNLPILCRSEIPLITVGDTVAIIAVGGTAKTLAVIGGITATG